MSFNFTRAENHVRVGTSWRHRRLLGTMEGIGELHRGDHLNLEFEAGDTFVCDGAYMLVRLGFTGGQYEADFMFIGSIVPPSEDDLIDAVQDMLQIFEEEQAGSARCEGCGMSIANCDCNLFSAEDGTCVTCGRMIHMNHGCEFCGQSSSSSTSQTSPPSRAGGPPIQFSGYAEVDDESTSSESVSEMTDSNRAASQSFRLPPAPSRGSSEIVGIPPEQREFDVDD